MTSDNPGASQAKSCFKVGCCGCLGLFLAFLLLLAVTAILQARAADLPPEIETGATEQTLPTPPPLPTSDLSTSDLPTSDEAGQAIAQDGIAMPNILPLEGAPLPRLEDPEVGRLVLDLSLGDFKIRSGPPGEPIRINADYDKRNFRLTEELIQDDSGAWTYRVKYGAKGGMLGLMARGGGNQPHSRLEIIIPQGQPLDVQGFVGLGESDIDLGGLWVRNVDLEFGTGDHVIEFTEPLTQPMESFRAEKGIGEFRVRSLGNAGPATVDIDQQLGDLRVDLRGEMWQRDASVALNLGIGECRIRVPEEGVRVEIDKASVGVGERRINRPDNEDLSPDAPTITIRTEGSVGEVRIE